MSERIGDAYIRIHAEGKGFRRDLEKEFKDNEKFFESQGHKESEAYFEGWDRGRAKRGQIEDDMDSFVKHVDRSIGDSDAAANWAKEFHESVNKVRDDGKSFRDSFNDEFGKDVVDKFFNDIDKKLNSGRIDSKNALFREFGPLPTDAGLNQLRVKVAKFRDDIAKEQKAVDRMLLAQSKLLVQQETKAEIEGGQERLRLRQKLAQQALKITEERARNEERTVANMLKQQDHLLKEQDKAEVEDGKERLALRQKLANASVKIAETQQREEHERLVKLSLDRDKEFERNAKRLVEQANAVEGLTKRYNEMVHEVDTFRKSGDRSKTSIAELTEKIHTLGKDTHEAGVETDRTRDFIGRLDRGMKLASPRVNTLSRAFTRLVGLLDKSKPRNNFFNAIVRGVEGLTRVLGKTVKGIETFVAKGIGLLFPSIKAVDEEFSKFTATIGENGAAIEQGAVEASSSLPAFVASLASVAAGITVVIVAMGVLSALLVGLVTIVAALVSVVAIGLVGALGALAGALLPVIASVGVLLLSMQALGKVHKQLAPVTKELKALGKAAGSHLFSNVSGWAKDLGPILRRLRPAVIGVADALRTTISHALDSASSSKGFRKFTDTMNFFLPRATRKLGRALTNTFGALGGILRALTPLTNRFLNWLDKATGKFSKFTNSNAGQKKLKSFFKTAGDAAANLGDFIGAAGKALTDLFLALTPAGEKILKQMANSMREFAKWLTSKEGKKSIKELADFAEKLAPAIGDAVVALSQMFTTLSKDPGSRGFVVGLFKAITAIADFIAKNPTLIGDWFSAILFPIRVVQQSLKGIKDILSGIKHGNFGQIFKGLFETSPLALAYQVGKRVYNLIKDIVKAIGQIPFVKNIWQHVLSFGQDVLTKIGQIVIKLANIPVVKNVWEKVSNFGQSVLTLISNIIDKLLSIAPVRDVFGPMLAGIQLVVNALDTALRLKDRLSGGDGHVLTGPTPASDVLGSHPSASGHPAHGVQPRSVVVPQIVVNSPGTDPRAVASELMNHLAGVGY